MSIKFCSARTLNADDLVFLTNDNTAYLLKRTSVNHIAGYDVFGNEHTENNWWYPLIDWRENCINWGDVYEFYTYDISDHCTKLTATPTAIKRCFQERTGSFKIIGNELVEATE